MRQTLLERFSSPCSYAIPAVPHEVAALARREELQRDRDELDDLVEAARARGPQKRFQLRKRELDRIEIRTVGRQKAEARADAFDRRLHLRLLVHGEVIEDDHVTRLEGRDKYLLDVGEKRGIVDRPIEDCRRLEAVDAQCRDHGVRLPMAIRRVVAEPEPARAATIPAQQIGGDAGLVNEDVAARVVQRQRVLPMPPRRGNISAPLFVGEYRFF